jgi:predicted transcriptional regulator
MDKKAVIKDLKEALERVGLPQTWAARRLFISPPYLNRLIAGASSPSEELQQRMMKLTRTIRSSGLMETG